MKTLKIILILSIVLFYSCGKTITEYNNNSNEYKSWEEVETPEICTYNYDCTQINELPDTFTVGDKAQFVFYGDSLYKDSSYVSAFLSSSFYISVVSPLNNDSVHIKEIYSQDLKNCMTVKRFHKTWEFWVGGKTKLTYFSIIFEVF